MILKKLLVASALLCMTGCAGIMPSSSVPDEHHASSAPPQNQQPGIYDDFDDILVPPEVKLVPEKSIVWSTSSGKNGIKHYEGRVEPTSLFNYFFTNMPKDGWMLSNDIKYGRYLLVFEKPTRDCLISIDEGSITTTLEIWIKDRAGLANPSSTFSPQMERNLAQ